MFIDEIRWEDPCEKWSDGLGRYSMPASEYPIPDTNPIPPSESNRSTETRVWRLRLKYIQRHLRYLDRIFITGRPQKENFGYGEGMKYLPPVHKPIKGRKRTRDDINEVIARHLALADMGYVGRARRKEPFPNARRCIGYRDGGKRCLEPALNGLPKCRRHHLSTVWAFSHTHKAQRTKQILNMLKADLEYRGLIGEKALEFFGQQELDLGQELAISRALLQKALDLVEDQGENIDRKDIVFLMEQTKNVAGLVKQNVDARSKVALTESDVKLMHSRIIQAMIECVPKEMHAKFMGLISGRGTDGILQSLNSRGLSTPSLSAGDGEASGEAGQEEAIGEVLVGRRARRRR